MKRIVHLSDLHFGRDRPELLDPLLTAVNAAQPDVVAISGDLTQRARRSQFAEARAFVDRIVAPQVIVPGNHDIPLDLPVTRILRPFERYRTAIDKNLEPWVLGDELAVFGLNTVTRWSWQRGRARKLAVRRLCRAFAAGPAHRINVIVAHHPFRHSPGSDKDPMIGADAALEALSDCGAHVVLSGHLHAWHTEAHVSRMQETRVLQVQAGTGLSNRLRGEENDFAQLDFTDGSVHIERWVAGEGQTRFDRVARTIYKMGPRGWLRLGAIEEKTPPNTHASPALAR